MRQGEALALGARRQQHGGGRRGLAEADRGDVGLDELHRVVDGEQRGDVAAGRVDVEVDVLVGVLGLEVQQLGADQVGDRVVDRRAQEDDVLLEQPASRGRSPARRGWSARRRRGCCSCGARSLGVLFVARRRRRRLDLRAPRRWWELRRYRSRTVRRLGRRRGLGRRVTGLVVGSSSSPAGSRSARSIASPSRRRSRPARPTSRAPCAGGCRRGRPRPGRLLEAAAHLVGSSSSCWATWRTRRRARRRRPRVSRRRRRPAGRDRTWRPAMAVARSSSTNCAGLCPEPRATGRGEALGLRGGWRSPEALAHLGGDERLGHLEVDQVGGGLAAPCRGAHLRLHLRTVVMRVGRGRRAARPACRTRRPRPPTRRWRSGSTRSLTSFSVTSKWRPVFVVVGVLGVERRGCRRRRPDQRLVELGHDAAAADLVGVVLGGESGERLAVLRARRRRS